MSATKSFDEYWVSTGCHYPKNDVSDRGIAHRAWDAAKPAVIANTSTNSSMDAIIAMYGKWRTTVGKHYDATVLDHFLEWAQQQHQ